MRRLAVVGAAALAAVLLAITVAAAQLPPALPAVIIVKNVAKVESMAFKEPNCHLAEWHTVTASGDLLIVVQGFRSWEATEGCTLAVKVVTKTGVSLVFELFASPGGYLMIDASAVAIKPRTPIIPIPVPPR